MRRVTPSDPLSFDEIRQLAGRRFGDMVKGVVDLRRRIVLLDADMHADQEAELLADPRLRASRPRLREIARAREVVVDYLAGSNQYGSTAPSLLKYFDAFALAARREASRR
jgi:hypothetical protein